MAGILDYSLITNGAITNKDVINRVEFYKEHIDGNVGAYSAS